VAGPEGPATAAYDRRNIDRPRCFGITLRPILGTVRHTVMSRWSQERGRSGVAVDWEELRSEATKAAALAYAPYSKLSVGAAASTADGRLVTGCNVENASYGLTLCAECGLVSSLHASGGGRLSSVSIVAKDGSPIAPCGRCRQLLFEAGGDDLLVDAEPEPVRLSALLPSAFSSSDVAERREHA
jgi:cytidine deaminase